MLVEAARVALGNTLGAGVGAAGVRAVVGALCALSREGRGRGGRGEGEVIAKMSSLIIYRWFRELEGGGDESD